jgi:hypothetical protein
MSPEQYERLTADLMSKQRIYGVLGIMLFFVVLAFIVCMF